MQLNTFSAESKSSSLFGMSYSEVISIIILRFPFILMAQIKVEYRSIDNGIIYEVIYLAFAFLRIAVIWQQQSLQLEHQQAKPV